MLARVQASLQVLSAGAAGSGARYAVAVLLQFHEKFVHDDSFYSLLLGGSLQTSVLRAIFHTYLAIFGTNDTYNYFEVTVNSY